MYANAVPNIVQQTKELCCRATSTIRRISNEVAVIVAQKLAGREKEIGEGMAKVYANEFTEQELKDLVDVLQVAAGPEAADDGAARPFK